MQGDFFMQPIILILLFALGLKMGQSGKFPDIGDIGGAGGMGGGLSQDGKFSDMEGAAGLLKEVAGEDGAREILGKAEKIGEALSALFQVANAFKPAIPAAQGFGGQQTDGQTAANGADPQADPHIAECFAALKPVANIAGKGIYSALSCAL